jgi:membrane dipeptidase
VSISSDQVERIHREATVVVDHDHRPIGPDLPLMLTGGVTAKVFQVVCDVDPESGFAASRDREQGWLRLAVRDMAHALVQIEAHSDICSLATTVDDVRRAKSENRIAILLGAEGAAWLESSLEPLHLFYRLGLRELQLTWAFPNQLVPDGKLSKFGQGVVAECGRLGIVVDVTHIPRPAFDQVIARATKPIIVSHGSAVGVTTDLDDSQIRDLASTGGLLGIHFYITYLGPDPTPDDVVRQLDYVAGLVGIDHVALGVDFFPTGGAWYDLQAAQGATNLQWAVDDMSQMPLITRALVERGYSEADITKILGGNFLRVCEATFTA